MRNLIRSLAAGLAFLTVLAPGLRAAAQATDEPGTLQQSLSPGVVDIQPAPPPIPPAHPYPGPGLQPPPLPPSTPPPLPVKAAQTGSDPQEQPEPCDKPGGCPTPSRFRIALDINGGYMFLWHNEGGESSGPVVDWGLWLTWAVGATRRTHLGMRFHGFYSPSVDIGGGGENMMVPLGPGSGGMTQENTLGGMHVGFVAEGYGLWGSPGFGFVLDSSDFYDSSGQLISEESHKLVEMCIAGGYNLALGRHFALRASVEIGTPIIGGDGGGWRVQVTGGARVSF